ncbi:Ig-like domain-containing protein [Enterococcus plantarum]|uniref:Ig-like domain-containing protein n=1 Tax=Enterococcus plantarum TaxID=1077675 RepID=UPI001A8CF833|nr:Ig-like domain-containing protein [Enterococcus plantarum]MBO0422059.1 Ig-like domain-containing protein [Enterococcus plantarum]
MKKSVVLILGLFLFSFSASAQAEVKEKEEINQEMLEPFLHEQGTSDTVARKRSAKQIIYLPEKDVSAIKTIQQGYQNMMSSQINEAKFLERPILENGLYSLGTFNPKVQESIEKQINFYRGLGHLEKIPLSEKDIATAQHAAIGMASVRKQTHGLSSLTKPADMPQTFWDTAGQATRSSNLHSSYKENSLNSHFDGYITDYGNTNTSVGHRTNILGLQAISIGTGYAQANGPELTTMVNYFTATYLSSDYLTIAKKYSNDFITQWPSANYFPVQLYNKENPYNIDYYKNNKDPILKAKYEKNMRWSIHFNQKGYKIEDDANVELINNDTGEKLQITTDAQGGELTVNNPTPGYYGQGGYTTLTFKPNNDFSIVPNAVYTVNVKGLLKDNKPFTYSYSTRMIDMDATYEIGTVPVTGISISPKELTMGRGDKSQLTAILAPATATNREVEWSTNDETIATVDSSGLVTANKPGRATISVKTADGGYQFETTVTVEDRHIPVDSIQITDKKPFVVTQIANNTTIEVQVMPENASNTKLVWESENPAIAAVDQEGNITAKSFGRTKITVYSQENPAKNYTFTVITDDHSDLPDGATPLTIGKITEGRYDIGLYENLDSIPWYGDYDYFYFKAPTTGNYIFTGFAKQPDGNEESFEVAYYTNKLGSWNRKSYFSDFHSVNLAQNEEIWFYIKGQRILDPLKPANFIIDSKVGSTYSLMIDLQENYSFGSIVLSDTANNTLTGEQKLSVGDSIKLNASVENATIQNPFYYSIDWKSSNKNIAEVDAKTGEITAKVPGKVMITAENRYGIFVQSKISKSITFVIE